jgi:hypothetical protein
MIQSIEWLHDAHIPSVPPAMAPRVKLTSEPQVIQLADGAKFPTHYNDEKKTHEISCDLCGEIISVGPAGTTSYRLESHRTPCEKRVAKQNDETDRFRAENTIPGSDDIDIWAQESDDNKTPHGNPEKRPRERSGATNSDSHIAKQSRLHM